MTGLKNPPQEKKEERYVRHTQAEVSRANCN